jgi:hypothetical protein
MGEGPVAKIATSRAASIVLATSVGVLVAFACITFLGISSAIPWPTFFYSWATSSGLVQPALFVWGICVVGGVGLAIPTLAAMVVLSLAYPANRISISLACLGGVLLGYYILVPLVYFESPFVMLNRRWWSFGQDLSLIASFGVACAWEWPSRVGAHWSRR